MSQEKIARLDSTESQPSRHYAAWIDRLSVEGAFAVLAKARSLEAQGKSIVHLEIGEPDFETPKHIKDAAVRSIMAGDTHYAPSAGLMELRKAVADHVTATRGVPVSAEEVLIAPGTKFIIFLTLMILIEEGDEVILPNPGYSTYESVVKFIGAKPVYINLLEEKDFRFEMEQLEKKITRKTRMIILNSPQNPTGGVLTADDMARIAFLSSHRNITVMSDEIYGRIVYDTPFASYYTSKEIKPHTILVDGFSKAYAMTGWRLGFGIMPKSLVEAALKFTNNTTACTCTFVQKAGIEALIGPQEPVAEMVKEFKVRREVMVKGLNEIPGFKCRMPKGAFYAFANIKETNMTSQVLADFLLEKAGVAALSGTAFGPGGEGYLRFSYANSIPQIEEGLRRIKEVLR